MPSPSPSDDALEDDPLDELVAEVIVLRERGRKDALDEVCEAHPESADALRQRIARLDGVQGAFNELQALARERDLPRRFGHYTILRELGRGGMGVVFLARDERLGRPVALKAMTAPTLAGERGRKRFEREVHAIAALEHPCIVPIFEAGEEAGTPYFTMQYVEGRTLSSALAALRSLRVEPARLTGEHLGGSTRSGRGTSESSRSTADSGSKASRPEESGSRAEAKLRGWTRGYLEIVCRIVLDVAEALEHAHAHGILHRDVKPSNVLLRPDERAMLVDFGLARVEASGSMTHTGDFVGTPHYVSPEQIRGGEVQLDARTDVYALGATLYELLTLRVPFDGSTTQEVFNKIAAKEPVPVRRLNPAVPRDLETICHTAISKEREHRYATAADMAADLRRFLQFRPVVARPVGVGTRALRWTRRNPAPAVAATLALLLLVGGPLTFGVYSNAARRALEHEQEATEAERDRADLRAAEAERQRARADRNVARVLRTIDEMLTRIAQEDLAHLPRMDGVRREFLERALALHRELLAEEGDDPALLRDTVRAQRRVGRILHDLGRLEPAAVAAQRAIEMQRGLLESSKGQLEDLQELAVDLTLAAHVAESMGDTQRPEVLLREAVELRERASATAPDDEELRDRLAGAHLNLGTAHLHRGRQREAEGEYRRALSHWSGLVSRAPRDATRRLSLAETLVNLGAVLMDSGRLEEAEAVGRESLAIWRELLDEHPDWFSARLGCLKASGNLAEVLASRGDAEEALGLVEETIELGSELQAEHPDVPEFAEALATAHSISVSALAAAGRFEEAIAAAEESLAQLEELAVSFPDTPGFRHRCAFVLEKLANVYRRLGRGEDELATREQAVAARREIVEAEPESIPQQSRLGGALNNLARATAAAGDPQRATLLLEEAIEHQRIAHAAEPDDPRVRTFLRNHLWGLTETCLSAGDAEAAAAAARQLPELDRGDGEEHRRAAGMLARCAALARAQTSPSAEREASAVGWELEALALLLAALERRATDLADLSDSADLAPLHECAGFAELLAAARAAMGVDGN